MFSLLVSGTFQLLGFELLFLFFCASSFAVKNDEDKVLLGGGILIIPRLHSSTS